MVVELIYRVGSDTILTPANVDANFRAIQVAFGNIPASSSGTVTAFTAGAFSPLFTTSVATGTSTPALSFVAVTQAANLVYASPTTGAAAAPTFRSLVVADLPTITVAKGGTNLTSLLTTDYVLASSGSVYVGRSLTSYDNKLTITASATDFKWRIIESNLVLSNMTGVLANAHGGTGVSAAINGQILIGNTSTGGFTLATLTAGTNVTIDNTTPGAITINVALAGTLAIANGGTNNTSFTTNGVLYYDGTKITNGGLFTFDVGTKFLTYGTANAGTVSFYLSNTSNNATASTDLSVINDASGGLTVKILSSAYTTSNVYAANRAVVWSTATEGLHIFNNTAAKPTAFWFGATEGAAVQKVSITSTGIGIGASKTAPAKNIDTEGDILIHGLTLGLGTGSVATNAAFGYQALNAITSGAFTVAIGYQVGISLTTQSNNVLYGVTVDATSHQNTLVGTNIIGGSVGGNTIMGYNCFTVTTTAAGVSSFGAGSASSLTSGVGNCFFGFNSGADVTTGANNVIIGSYRGTTTLTNSIVLSIGETGGASGAVRAFCDSNGYWGFGTTTPNSSFQTVGSVSRTHVQKTTTYTLTINDYIVECISGSFTVTLPTAVGCEGRIYVIDNSGGGTITVATTSSQTINGASTQSITTNSSITIYSNNANWRII